MSGRATLTIWASRATTKKPSIATPSGANRPSSRVCEERVPALLAVAVVDLVSGTALPDCDVSDGAMDGM